MTVKRAQRTDLDGLPDWARIGVGWDIGIGEPMFLDPGEDLLDPAEDTLYRILFGTLKLASEDHVYGLDPGWVLVGEIGAPFRLQVQTRTQLRQFTRARIEAASRLWRAYGRCTSARASQLPSSLGGEIVAQPSLVDLLPWLPRNGAILLRDAEGPLSQVLASLPAHILPTLSLQRPYEGPLCPESMAFYDGGDAHVRVVETLAAAGVAIRREELLVRREDEVSRWLPCDAPSSPHLLEALARLLPHAAPVLRDVLLGQRRFEPVLRALATKFPNHPVAWWPIALAGPLDAAAAQAWNIGPIVLPAAPREPPFGQDDFAVAAGAVDGVFRSCAIVVGSTTTCERLTVDIECAAEHEIVVHRCLLERCDGQIVVCDERCIVQED